MATANKKKAVAAPRAAKQMQIILPKKIAAAARSRSRPNDQTESGQQLRDTPLYQSVLNNSARSYKDNASNVIKLIRHLARAEGPFSSAVHNMVEITKTNYLVLAYDSVTHSFSPEGTLAAMAIMSQLDTPTDYTGFTKKKSLTATISMMLRESMLTGAVGAEMVLTKEGFFDFIQIVGAETLSLVSDGKGGSYPQQQQAGQSDPVKLDIPTFFFEFMHPDPDSVVPRSMLESALKMLIYFEELMDDIRRAVRSAGHNRATITLDAEKIQKLAPREYHADPAKMQDFLASVQQGVQQQLESIEPEQALVLFDSAKADVLQSGTGSKVDYTPLLGVAVGQYATAMKTPPSVLGLRLDGGSQNTGSVETTMFLKSAKALQGPVETVMSRALTLGIRLNGVDAYVSFEFNALDLRPEAELQAFRSMELANLKERLSMGLISDDEFAARIGCFPRPPGASNLSGTMFMDKGAQQSTGQDLPIRPGDTPVGKTLQPETPSKAGGKSK